MAYHPDHVMTEPQRAEFSRSPRPGDLMPNTRDSPIAEELRALDAAVARYGQLLERLSPLIPQVPMANPAGPNGGPQAVRSILVQEIHDLRLRLEEYNSVLDRVEV